MYIHVIIKEEIMNLKGRKQEELGRERNNRNDIDEMFICRFLKKIFSKKFFKENLNILESKHDKKKQYELPLFLSIKFYFILITR